MYATSSLLEDTPTDPRPKSIQQNLHLCHSEERSDEATKASVLRIPFALDPSTEPVLSLSKGSESLVVVATTLTRNENTGPGSTTVRVRTDVTVTLRPQPKGLGWWARYVGEVVLVLHILALPTPDSSPASSE